METLQPRTSFERMGFPAPQERNFLELSGCDGFSEMKKYEEDSYSQLVAGTLRGTVRPRLTSSEYADVFIPTSALEVAPKTTTCSVPLAILTLRSWRGWKAGSIQRSGNAGSPRLE